MKANKIDWHSIRFRSHMIGDIMTAPRDKAAKEAGEFGATAIKGLLKIYALEKHGREKKLDTAAIRKGLGVEEIGIKMVSDLEGGKFVKNEERVSNSFFTGIPDMHDGKIKDGKMIKAAKIVRDHKASWDYHSFIANAIIKPGATSPEVESKRYYFQGQSYMALTGAKTFILDFTLQDCPEIILSEERRKLMWKMGAATDESPEYKQAVADLEHELTFGDIDPVEKHIKIIINRNDEDIEKMEDAVVRGRVWLEDFDKRMCGK